VNWETEHSKLTENDYETSEFHQDMWNRDLMIAFVLAHIPGHTLSNLELWRSYKALQSDLVLLSGTTHSNICWTEYPLTVDAIMKQLLSWTKVRFPLEWLTSMNKLAITWVCAYCMDRHWAVREVQLAFDDIDRLFFSSFDTWWRMIGEGPTYWSKASWTFEGCSWSLSA